MDSILTALQQPFFVRSMIVVVLLSFIFPLYGNIVVIRKESNIAHTFAHIWLLGVAIWLWCNRSIELSILGSIVLTVWLLFLQWSREHSNHVAHNEIGAQLWLVWAILIVSQMSGYRADISSYLFGDILLLWRMDIIIIGVITCIALGMYACFWKRWLWLSLHKSLASSKNIPTNTAYILYLIALWLIIWGAMKIIGVLLVSAFLILPSNIWKQLASNLLGRNGISIFFWVISSIIALFVSWHLDMPSGASIVACLLIIYFVVILIQALRK